MSVADREIFTIITGASRGIGREIALQLSKMVAKNSAFIITARNSKFLEEVKKIMQKNNDIYVHIIEGDMINLNDAFFDKFEKAMNEILSITKSFDALLLVNNAGTLGAINKPAIDLGCREIWQEYLQINLISMIQLTNFVLKKLPFEMIPTQFVINITSLCSIKALPSLCQYCVGKAGREAFFRSLAAENPSLRILSYSPGPVRTDMYNELSTGTYDENMRKYCKRFNESDKKEEDISNRKRILTAPETVEKLISIINRNEFISGTRIDFFD